MAEDSAEFSGKRLFRLHRGAEFRAEVGLRESAGGDHDLLNDDRGIDHVDLERVGTGFLNIELSFDPAQGGLGLHKAIRGVQPLC